MQSFAVSCSDAASIVEKPRARSLAAATASQRPQPHSGHSLTVAVASGFFLTWDNFHQEILKTGDSWLER